MCTSKSLWRQPASVPAKTLQEFIALAKQKPGQLVAGTAGTGQQRPHGTGALPGDGRHRPHHRPLQGRGGGATIDLLGGTVHISNITIKAAIPHLKAGRINALGVGGLKRNAAAGRSDRVRIGTAGYLSTGWRGLMGPAGIPPAITGRLTREMKAVLTSDEVRTHFANNAMDIDYRDPKQFTGFISDEIRRWEGEWSRKPTSACSRRNRDIVGCALDRAVGGGLWRSKSGE